MSAKQDNISSVQTQQILDLLLSNWESLVNAITAYYNQYEDSFYDQQVAPDRNRAIYILGHLVASNDGLNVLFDFNSREYEVYQDIFHTHADGEISELPKLQEMKNAWENLNKKLLISFRKMTPSQWLERHTAVTEEDFKRESNRNKLNVLISRLTHLGYHLGQLNLLKNND